MANESERYLTTVNAGGAEHRIYLTGRGFYVSGRHEFGTMAELLRALKVRPSTEEAVSRAMQHQPSGD